MIIKNLCKKFGDKIIFENFNYRFSQNGVYALVGKSGIGKTTLLRMIAGLDNDYDGEIVKESSPVGYAFQEHRLIPTLTALDNIIVACFDKKNKESVTESKKILKALNFSETDIELYPSQMSGGMKQRVSLARAFLSKRTIILLDEPTKELDEDNKTPVFKLINEFSKSCLIIMSTHDSDTIEKTNSQIIRL